MSAVPRPNRRRDFELAIICALPLEADAIIALFDHHHSEDREERYGKAADDANAYTTGVIGNHNVVVAHMPGMGKVSAAGVAVGLRMSFPNIKLALVVGICGGVPGGLNAREIYLGDVVISQCLVQYDFGKQYPMAFEPKDSIQGGSGVPPIATQALLRKIETDYHSAQLQEDTEMFLRELQAKSKRALYPGADRDLLFKPSYLHQHRDPTDCVTCGTDGSHACANALVTTCHELGCGGEGLVHRERHSNSHEQVMWPSIHFGKMGSGDTVMKSGTHRDGIARRDGIIAFEMEGAGVYAYFPSLVIKGVCDYADSHKNGQWQNYAAAAAAACTKAFLKRWASERVYHDLVEKPAVKPIFMVDILRDNSLIGRDDVMKFLESKLSQERHNRVALVALGGVG
jgi:nucleoside phosphorylase